MKDKQSYINKAEACLKGIEKIKSEIEKYESIEKRAEVAFKYAKDLEILEKEYNKARAMYDPTFEE